MEFGEDINADYDQLLTKYQELSAEIKLLGIDLMFFTNLINEMKLGLNNDLVDLMQKLNLRYTKIKLALSDLSAIIIDFEEHTI